MSDIDASTIRQGSREPTAETLAGTPRARVRRREAPLVLERYRLHRQLGAGGFGTVWLARDERLERDVAVKIVSRDRIVGGRFEREARAAARLAHPGIVTLYEAGADEEGAYLVSELVRGPTLGDLLDAGRLSDREIVEIGIALCDALAHAHGEGVVHRDVKPSNVLIPEHPSSPGQVAKLTDFGVARIVGGDSLTRTGDVVGTAAYMAPEQAEGRDVGAPADLYALALVLYEGLTGVNPVRTGTAAQRARRLGAHLPAVRRQRRDLPRDLGDAIDLALRPRPRERGTIEDLRCALAAGSGQLSDRSGVVAPAWRPWREPPAVQAVHEPWPREANGLPLRRGAFSHPREEQDDDAPLPAHRVRWPERGLAGLATAGVAGWLAAHLVASAPLTPLVVALLAGMLVAALPRAGWLAFVLAFAVWLSFENRTGAAVIVGLGGLLPALLAPWRATAWARPVGAPALGAIGLAGAWPGLAARVRGAPTRAALGAVGWTWTALGTSLSGTDLYLRAPPGTPPASQWFASAGDTVRHVLEPLVSSGALAPALVWAGAAVVLPWVVRGRRLAVDFVLASAWAAGLLAATYSSLAAVHGSLSGAPVHRGVLGAAAAFAIVMEPSLVRALRTRRVSAQVP